MSLTRAARLTALLIVVAGSPTAFAADPIRWRADYTAARKEAEETGKPLLIVVGTADCLYCVKMEAVTFADAEAAKIIAERFVPLKLDAAAHPEFVRAMRVSLYPTTVIAGPDAKVYAYLAGYLDAAGFRENAGKALALIPVPMKPVAAIPKPAPVKPVAPPADAIAALEAAAAELDARTAAAYLELAELWVKQGRPKEAAAYFEKAARTAPNGKLAETALARLAAIKD